MLILHVVGVAWFKLVSIEREWSPPLDFIYASRNEFKRFYDMEQVTEFYQYLVSLYVAVLALGGNEMGPRTDVEILFMTLLLITFILLNAYVFGRMTVLVSDASKKSSELQEQVDVANTAMNNLSLNQDTKEKIRMYLISTQGTQYEQKQLKEFFDMLSPTINKKVASEIFLEVIKNNLQFRSAIMQIAKKSLQTTSQFKKTITQVEEQLILPIVTEMTTRLAQPDDPIVTIYHQAENLYFIAKGECEVFLRSGDLHDQSNSQKFKQATQLIGEDSKTASKAKRKHKRRILREGQLFGEISLVYQCETTATVMAVKYCTIGVLTDKAFEKIVKSQPQIMDRIKQGIYEYDDMTLRFVKLAIA